MWHEDLLAWHRANSSVVTGDSNKGSGFQLSAAVVAAAGTGYVVGDQLTLLAGTFSSAATVTVLTVGAGGALLTVSISNPGSYAVVPPNAVDTVDDTTGTATGATLTATWGAGLGGGVQLCTQDPARVYLSIAVADGNTAWFSPSPMTDVNQGIMVASFGCDGQLIFRVPADSILAKLSWYAWGASNAQPYFVVTATYPECPRPTWRDNQRARPLEGSLTGFQHANAPTVQPKQRSGQGKQSVFNPNWDDIDEADRP